MQIIIMLKLNRATKILTDTNTAKTLKSHLPELI